VSWTRLFAESTKLIAKGVDYQSNCVVCQSYTEYNWHLFLCCEESITCWRQIQLWPLLENLMEDAEGFRDVFVKLLQHLNQAQLVQFAMTASAWSIWKKRNLKLWENKHETVDQVLNRAKGVLSAWQVAEKNNSRTGVTGPGIA
jgi:hypothetical protein